jgi:hypothetical protein
MKQAIIDTDIGTDVDDAMAISLAALSPDLEILGVTTVHADAPLRARIARKLLDLAGRNDVPVVSGASHPLQMPLPYNFTWMPRLRRPSLSASSVGGQPAPSFSSCSRICLDGLRPRPGRLPFPNKVIDQNEQLA